MARSLAVFSESLEALADELCIVCVDIQTEEYQSPSSGTTDAVQEPQSVQDQIVTRLAELLLPQIILQVPENSKESDATLNGKDVKT